MPWTEKQEQVIKERDKTILVSAAAGSGKTATLVERIYQKIIDTEHPVDITSFLVVTFTKAAAAQMKEKLLKKLEEAQEQYPESEHIAKQNMLIQSADITTIDSFCLNIVKEYFSFLNLDPSVGIGDPGMLEMLKYDVMTELFDTKYAQLQEQPDTEFGRLLELFCDGKRDDNLKDVIDKIYQQITSFPDPSRFLEEAREALQIETAEDLNRAAWMQAMLDILHKKAAAAKTLAQRCLALCEEADGPVYTGLALHHRPAFPSLHPSWHESGWQSDNPLTYPYPEIHIAGVHLHSDCQYYPHPQAKTPYGQKSKCPLVVPGTFSPAQVPACHRM